MKKSIRDITGECVKKLSSEEMDQVRGGMMPMLPKNCSCTCGQNDDAFGIAQTDIDG